MAENNGAYFDYPDYTPKATFFRSSPRNTKQITVKANQVIKALSFLETDANGVGIVAGALVESAALTFDADLTSGQTLIIAGLTFTAETGGTTTKQLTNAFSGLKDGYTGGTVPGGVFTGTLTDYSTTTTGLTTVTFVASTSGVDATDLTITGTGAGSTTLVVAQGNATPTGALSVLVYDLDTTDGDVEASVYTEASFWADALVWGVDVATDTITLADGTLKAVTAYNTGAHTKPMQQKFVEASEFDPLGFSKAGEVY